jgi:hypothetical protein
MSEWQPMSTAPKDGREVLLLIPNNGANAYFSRALGGFRHGQWTSGTGRLGAWLGTFYDPAGWAPVPDPIPSAVNPDTKP